jgi:hypothetical protein
MFLVHLYSADFLIASLVYAHPPLPRIYVYISLPVYGNIIVLKPQIRNGGVCSGLFAAAYGDPNSILFNAMINLWQLPSSLSYNILLIPFH